MLHDRPGQCKELERLVCKEEVFNETQEKLRGKVNMGSKDDKEITCELCKKVVDKDSVAWNGPFALCVKCFTYLYPNKRKKK